MSADANGAAEIARRPATPRQRLLRVLAWVAAVLLGLRLLLWIALPLVLDGVAGRFGLRCEIDDLSLAVRTGRLELHGLTLRPESGADPGARLAVERESPGGLQEDDFGRDERVGKLDYAFVDLDMGALLAGRVHLQRVDIDGLAVLVHRAAAAGTSADAPAEADRARADDREPIDLTLPVAIDALRVQRARCVLRDEAVSPPLATELALDVRLSDLGSAERPARLLVRAEARGLLDELRVEGTLSGGADRQQGALAFSVRGLRPAPLAGYLAEASLAPHADSLALEGACSGEAHVNAERSACGLQLSLDGLRLQADGATALALDQVRLVAPAIGDERADLGELLVRGLHASAERTPSGALRFAGLDALPAGSAPDAARADEPAAPGAAWSLARLLVEDVQLDVHDGAVAPAADLSLELAHLELGPLRGDATADTPASPIAATFRAPGLFDTCALAGTVAPFGPRTGLDVRLELAGLRPTRAAPHLRAAGLRSTLEDGALTMRLQAVRTAGAQGGFSADARLTDLVLRDGATTLLALPAVRLDELSMSAGAAELRLGSIDITGPSLDVQRDAAGELHALGLATLGSGDRDAAAPAATSEPAAARTGRANTARASTARPTPRLLLGRLRWHDVALHVRDEAVAPPIDLTLHDAGLELSDLALGGDPAQGEARTGAFRLWLGAEGILERVQVEGTLLSRPGPLDVVADLALHATGVQGGQAASWMSAAGLASEWRDGSLALALHAALAERDGALHADAALTDLVLENAGRRWLALKRAGLERVTLTDDALTVGTLELAGLDAHAERDAQGALHFAGIGLPRVPPTRTPPPAPLAQTTRLTRTGQVPARARRVALERLSVEDVACHFTDAAVVPAVAASVSLAAHLAGLDSGAAADAAPARFDLALVVPGSLDRLTLEGGLRLAPDAQSVHAELRASGLRAGGLSGYLPPGWRSELRDGQLALRLDARRDPAAAGGERLECVLADLSLRDGADAPPLCALSRLALVAPRVDLAGGAVDVDELALRGVELTAHRGLDGSVHALGLVLGGEVSATDAGPPPATPVDDRPSAAPPQAAPADAAPTNAAPTNAAPTNAAPTNAALTNVAAGAARVAAALPVVRLRALDVELSRLAWSDERLPDAPVLARAHLFNPAPLVLLDREPEALPPWDLVLEAACSPALDALRIGLRVAPFVDQPSLELRLQGSGLHGAGLAALSPGLAARIDGSELVQGTLAAHALAQLEWPRRGPVDFDLSHGFGAHLAMDGLELRREPQGEVLAGLDALDLVVERVSPASGDVHVSSLELRTPRALLVNRADGLHVLGLRLLPAPPAPAGAAEPRDATVSDATASDAAARRATGRDAAPRGVAARGELRIDSASITGLDLALRDETLSPPLLLPIDSLDAELSDFSTSERAARPTRFGAFVGAGEVPLPAPVRSSSVLAGLATATVARLSGADESATVLEPRRVFQEIALTGRISPGPVPTGWVQLHVAGLELVAFASAARSADVLIGDGVMDGSVKLRFRGADGVAIDSSTTLTDLSLSESANGPIGQYLKLPAPLDTVVFLLRDEQGQIRLDLGLHVGAQGVSGAEIAQEAAGTLGALVTRAVASSPLRVTGMLTDAIGVTGGKVEQAPELPLLLDFGPGDARLPPEQRTKLASLAARLRDEPDLTVVLEQSLGAGDVEHAALLANPPAAESAEVAQHLRQELREAVRRRDELSAQARSFFAVGRDAEAVELAGQLASIDHDVGVLELGLDRVLELLRPGAGRRADQRTRAGGLALGNLRLAAVADALREEGVPDPARAIEVRPARWLLAEGRAEGVVSLQPRLRPRPRGMFAQFFGWLWPF